MQSNYSKHLQLLQVRGLFILKDVKGRFKSRMSEPSQMVEGDGDVECGQKVESLRGKGTWLASA